MDLQGSLVDTSLKIYPSEILLKFLQNHKFDDNIPDIIKAIIKGETNKPIKNGLLESTPVNTYITQKDIEHLEKIKNIVLSIKPDKDLVTDDKEKALKEKSDSELVDKDDVNGDSKKYEKTDLKSIEVADRGPYLTTSEIDWLYLYLKQKRKNGDDVPYLHELLERSEVKVPNNEIIKRNPDLEARCVKLRAQQEARDYRKMTKGVDNVRMRFPEDSISYQLKQMNRQLIAIGQFIISIFAGFLFGFRGVEWMVGNLDFGFRLLLGVMCALIIALAEIYFLAKKLNEELSVPETTQLGGPPKFADEKFNDNRIRKPAVDKPHQD